MITKKSLKNDLKKIFFKRWETKDDECLLFIKHIIDGMNPELLDILIYDWNKKQIKKKLWR